MHLSRGFPFLASLITLTQGQVGYETKLTTKFLLSTIWGVSTPTTAIVSTTKPTLITTNTFVETLYTTEEITTDSIETVTHSLTPITAILTSSIEKVTESVSIVVPIIPTSIPLTIEESNPVTATISAPATATARVTQYATITPVILPPIIITLPSIDAITKTTEVTESVSIPLTIEESNFVTATLPAPPVIITLSPLVAETKINQVTESITFSTIVDATSIVTFTYPCAISTTTSDRAEVSVTVTATLSSETMVATSVGSEGSVDSSQTNHDCSRQFKLNDGRSTKQYYLSRGAPSRLCHIADIESSQEAYQVSLRLCAPVFVHSWETNDYNQTCLAIWPGGSAAIVPPLGGCNANLDTLCQ